MISEAHLGCDVRDGSPVHQQRTGRAQPELSLVVTGGKAVGLAKRAVDSEPASANKSSEFSGMDILRVPGVEHVANPPGDLNGLTPAVIWRCGRWAY